MQQRKNIHGKAMGAPQSHTAFTNWRSNCNSHEMRIKNRQRTVKGQAEEHDAKLKQKHYAFTINLSLPVTITVTITITVPLPFL